MSNLEEQEKIYKLALNQHERYLSEMDNVQGLGIVDLAPDDKKRKEKQRIYSASGMRERSVQDHDGDKLDTQLALAVYVTKKLPEEKLKEKDRVPKTLDVSMDGKIYTVLIKVIEQAEMSFQGEGFDSDDL